MLTSATTSEIAVDRILAIACCPECGGELRREQWSIRCIACPRQYPITEDGIPCLVSDKLRQALNTDATVATDQKPTEVDVKAANIRVYESVLDDYETKAIHADPTTVSRLKAALARLTAPPPKRHLDVGCGPGNVLSSVMASELRVGLDVSPAALRHAREHGHLVVQGDAERMPFRPGTFDLVTAYSTLHHLFEPQRCVAEAARTLTPGGLFVSDFDPNHAASQWGWLARKLFRLRGLLSKRRRVDYSQVRSSHDVAEFHNGPGRGIEPRAMTEALAAAGMNVEVLLLHNTRDSNVDGGYWCQPRLRHFVTQTLSLRNAFARKNADTFMLAARKR